MTTKLVLFLGFSFVFLGCAGTSISVDKHQPRFCENVERQTAYTGGYGDKTLPLSYYINEVSFTGNASVRIKGWGTTSTDFGPLEADVDLHTGEIKMLPKVPQKPFLTLCQKCNPLVFSVSPKGKYQLAVIRSDGEEGGIWIASSTEAAQISNYAYAFVINEKWLDDESGVWLSWSGPERGNQSAFISAIPAFQVKKLDDINSPLADTGHRLAFNLSANLLLSAKSGEYFVPNGELELYDLHFVPPKLTASKSVSATLINIVWDTTSKEFLLMFVEKDLIAIKTLEGKNLMTISAPIRNLIFEGRGSGPSAEDFSYGPGTLFAVSPSNDMAVVILGKIYVLSCK